MSKLIKPNESSTSLLQSVNKPIGRKTFLKFAGAGAALTTLLITGCDNDDEGSGTGGTGATVNLGSDDVGILNYAYALEQLEAAFYTQVIATKFSGMTALETSILTDIRDHEIAHREFFKAAITAAAPTAIIPGLTPDFTSINFMDRTSVLGAAKAFEDLGVSAYNGAGKLLKNPTYLTLAGKIVSVEARHAAEITDLITNGTFADSAKASPLNNNMFGFDPVETPANVLKTAQKYVKEQINGSSLPTT